VITAARGSVSLHDIRARGNSINITSAQGILEEPGWGSAVTDADADLTASTVWLTGGSAIGSEDPIETAAERIDVQTTGASADIGITNAFEGTTYIDGLQTAGGDIVFNNIGDGDDLLITAHAAGVHSGHFETRAGGDITIANSGGKILVGQAVDSSAGTGGNVDIIGAVELYAPVTSGAGKIRLEGADDAGADIIVNSTISSGGDLSLETTGDIFIRGLCQSHDQVTVSAKGSVILEDLPSDLISVGTGDVRLTGETGRISTTDGPAIDAGEGNVTIKAGGAITAIDREAPVDIVGAAVDLRARTGRIGPLGVLAKGHLDASTSEDIIISSPGDLRVGMVNAGEGNVTITASGTIAPIWSDAAVDVAGGVVNLTARAGKIDHLDVAVSERLYATTLDNTDIIISSPGELRLGSADTGGRIDIEANGAMAVAGGDKVEVQADESMTLHAGAGGEGNLSFHPDATLSSKDMVLRAGDGLDPDTIDLFREAREQEPDSEDWLSGAGAGATVDFANLHVSYAGIQQDDARSLTIWQDAPITAAPESTQFTPDSTAQVDLLLQSDVGNVSLTTADEWNSVSATALNGIKLAGPGDITTGTLRTRTGNISVRSFYGDIIANDLISAFWRTEASPHVGQYFDYFSVPGGGVELLADAGGIRTRDAPSLNVQIVGYSDGTAGVHLPGRRDGADRTAPPDDRDGTDGVDSPGEHYDRDGAALPRDDGVAAIVVKSHDNLILGEGVYLEARGTYEPGYVNDGRHDDRLAIDCLCGPPETYGTGHPFDAAIYVGSFGATTSGGGDVTVNGSVLIDDYGTMVIDAEDTVHDFGDRFTTSWREYNDDENGLELIARGTETLNDAFRYETLPGVSYRLEGESPPWLDGSPYVLRGMRPAEVLQKVETAGVPSVHPEGPEDDEIVPWPPETPVPDPEPPVEVLDAEDRKVKPRQAMVLGHDHTVTTGPQTRAFIDFPNDARIIMEPNTRVVIKEGGILVEFGKVWFWRLDEAAADRFEVRTDYITASVTGCEWALAYARTVHNVVSLLKRVRVESNGGHWKPVVLDPGQRASMSGNDAPRKTQMPRQQRAQVLEVARSRQQTHRERSKTVSMVSMRPSIKWPRLNWTQVSR
jgi:hypothetical protein